MPDTTKYNRLFWHSRRGMLELDLMLIPFLEEVYRDLPTDDQDRYEKLLTSEDTDMFEWLMQRSRPQDTELQRIVDLIVAHAKPV